MAISSNVFLYENKPQNNLETLANYQASDSSGTKCTTENAYKLAPKWAISPSTLREISLVSSLFIVLTGPFLFTAKKVYECSSLLFDAEIERATECRDNLRQAFSNPVNLMTYLSFAALVSLAGVGVYAGARMIFQDKTQEERFELLNTEYSLMAKHLDETYKTTRKDEVQNLVELAEKLHRNKDFIRANLIRTVKLTEPQASYLSAKISHTASLILSKERANSHPLPDTKLTAKSTAPFLPPATPVVEHVPANPPLPQKDPRGA